MNPPVKTGERNIVPENPWETFYAGGYNTVMEDEGIYKMWYECSSRDVRFRGVCYATSRDGIRWEKPVLELFEFNGSKRNNILLECQGAPGSVFLDPRKPDGNRFKYLEWRRVPGKERPPTLSLVLFTSSDGLHWKPYLDGPILTMKDQFDTQNQIFWDDRIEKYVGYVRLNHRIASRHRRFLNNYPIRKVGRFETADLAKCPTPEVVFSSDNTDPEESDHYTSCVMKYPFSKDVYLMFPSAYLHDLEAKRNNDDGPMDIQLATSRDRDPLAPARPAALCGARPGWKQRRRLPLHDDRDAAARKRNLDLLHRLRFHPRRIRQDDPIKRGSKPVWSSAWTGSYRWTRLMKAESSRPFPSGSRGTGSSSTSIPAPWAPPSRDPRPERAAGSWIHHWPIAIPSMATISTAK